MNTQIMFSSKTDKYDTPQTMINDLAQEFNWDLDVCASRPNVCQTFYDESVNGLKKPWFGLCWMNPPYGKGIGEWMSKAELEGNCNPNVKAVVCLVPARTDTKWWHGTVRWAAQVVFVEGRLRFGKATSSAPFPSAFVVFGAITPAQRSKLGSWGWDVSDMIGCLK